MIYPPDKMPGSISIKKCLIFQNTTTYANTTVDGIISRPYVPHRYVSPLESPNVTTIETRAGSVLIFFQPFSILQSISGLSAEVPHLSTKVPN